MTKKATNGVRAEVLPCEDKVGHYIYHLDMAVQNNGNVKLDNLLDSELAELITHLQEISRQVSDMPPPDDESKAILTAGYWRKKR